MTKALNEAFAKAKLLSPSEQDELAQTISAIVDKSVYILSKEEEADIDEGIAELERGEFFTLEEVRERLVKHRV